MALLRHAHIPPEVLPEPLQGQPLPLPYMVAQEEHLRNQADLWGAMDNEWRPGITLIVTIALDPYVPITAPLVRSRELQIGPVANPLTERLVEANGPDRFWTVGGILHSDQPFDEMQLMLVERNQTITIQEEGRFAIGNLRAGEYTLEVAVKDGKSRQHKITVPSADYDIKV